MSTLLPFNWRLNEITFREILLNNPIQFVSSLSLSPSPTDPASAWPRIIIIKRESSVKCEQATMGRHGSRRHHRGASSILHQLALIVALACPIICSAAPSESTDTSSTDIINSGHNNHHQYPQYVHHRRHHHQHHTRPNGPGTDQEQTNDGK